ncbi:hypothetical protein [Streptomyces sp. MA5143a]|uniref:hypothetical protein n=1 Tax=Streptomyces sp. MA5143a TaxID=2083010 RepID=UPI000D1AFE23|nr:hypothetical protein [Streptomyces sp. MA5143a]SPF07102.1 hypothetical protein SMA5143A_7947 [Streptomyces sp. MA5143a]
MRLGNHERNAMDLRTTPVHLGLGSRAKPVEGFTWDPEVLQAYSAAVAADGAGVWHVVDMEGPTSVLSITATLGTDHRPRNDTRPTEHIGTPSPEEAP